MRTQRRPAPGRARTLGWLMPLLAAGGLGVPLLFALPAAALPTQGSTPGIPGPFPTPIHHVVVVFLENEEAKDVLANGTFERSLAHRYAYANELYSPMHASIPNYLAATSGVATNQFSPLRVTNVGTLVGDVHRTWGEFEESMPGPCDLSHALASPYDPGHNPFVLYEPFIQRPAACDSHMLNFTAWNADVANGTVPNYALVVPNMTDDGHNSGLAGADLWLSTWLPPLLNDSFFRSTAMFILYDEGTTNDAVGGATSGGGGHIYGVLVSPYARDGYWSPVNYTTFSILTTTEWLLGLGHTGQNDSWATQPPMTDLFDLPQLVSGTVENGHGVPVVGVRVRDGVGPDATTNATGGFTFELRDGNYTLRLVRADGYVGRAPVVVLGAPVRGIVVRAWVAP